MTHNEPLTHAPPFAQQVQSHCNPARHAFYGLWLGLTMNILPLDLGKHNTVFCDYNSTNSQHEFGEVRTRSSHEWHEDKYALFTLSKGLFAFLVLVCLIEHIALACV